MNKYPAVIKRIKRKRKMFVGRFYIQILDAVFVEEFLYVIAIHVILTFVKNAMFSIISAHDEICMTFTKVTKKAICAFKKTQTLQIYN